MVEVTEFEVLNNVLGVIEGFKLLLAEDPDEEVKEFGEDDGCILDDGVLEAEDLEEAEVD